MTLSGKFHCNNYYVVLYTTYYVMKTFMLWSCSSQCMTYEPGWCFCLMKLTTIIINYYGSMPKYRH